MSYSVDTSALLDAWVRYYPPDVFGTLWTRLDALAREPRLHVVDEVCRELDKKDDGLYAWVKQRSSMIVALDGDIQSLAKPIINTFPSLTNSKSLMSGSADPFVIALAQQRGLIVITAEKPRPRRPRIPDVCTALDIPCITLVQMFRNEGWNF